MSARQYWKYLILSVACFTFIYFVIKQTTSEFEYQLTLSRILLVTSLLWTIGYVATNADHLKYYFHEKGHSFGLALFRIGFYGYFLFGLIIYPEFRSYFQNYVGVQVFQFSEMPQYLRQSLPGLGVVLSGLPVSLTITKTLSWVWLLFCSMSVLGLFTRFATLGFALLTTYLLGIPQLYGNYIHYHVIVYTSIFLFVSRSGDSISVDALVSGSKHSHRPSNVYVIPFRVLWLTMALTYFFPGFWKIWNCGLDWIFTDTLIHHVQLKWSSLPSSFPTFDISALKPIPTIAAAFTVWFELSFIFLLLKSKTRWLAFIGMATFHIGIYVVMNINFLPQVFLLFSSLILSELAISKTETPTTPSPEESKLDPNTFLLKSTFCVIFLIVAVHGIFQIKSWPFSVYPTFGYFAPTSVQTLQYEWTETKTNGGFNIKDRLKSMYSPHRYEQLEKDIIRFHQANEHTLRDQTIVFLLERVDSNTKSIQVSLENRLIWPKDAQPLSDTLIFPSNNKDNSWEKPTNHFE